MEQVHRQYQTNVFSVAALIKAFLPAFRCRMIGVQANLISCGTLPRSSRPARFPDTHLSFLNLLNLPK